MITDKHLVGLHVYLCSDNDDEDEDDDYADDKGYELERL